MRHYTQEQTRRALDFAVLIDRLDTWFREDVNVPLRHTHRIACGTAHGTSLIMPAWSERGYYGLKVINIFDGNAAVGRPGLHAVYTLFDARTGVPLATLDGDVLTAWRTAAASALGARFLAPADASTLLVVGAGRIAQLLPSAIKAVRPIERVLVWARDASKAKALAAQLRDGGHGAEVCQDLEAGVRRADIVSAATLSCEPLIQGAWLQPGSHLDLIGSFNPQMTEADPSCFNDADVYVDTTEAPTKSGDLLNALAGGALLQEDILGTLAALCRAECPVPPTDPQSRVRRTVFKAVGSALEDLAAATLVHECSQA
ncbi:ornithine cyclodeaminase family protein [Variovorax sp. J31P207]|uniref:ornithine cyclodeaminase family protein n=1 Tax=Variovorax sp. J31P207 TaxID=3053510 RepID=UPI002576C785|nr:ornithine cyclodeaminase family protein [Variovorax sp. J31P207]MDM0071577.1 ornithine cyclodeaminase family protein [Variovorax sp. J31P207]